MFDRLERPARILCLAMAALLVWQLGGLILRGDPLAHLKIPPLPVLPGTTNEPAKLAKMDTNAPVANKSGTNGTNVMMGTNIAKGTNTLAQMTNAPAAGGKGQTNSRPNMPPEMTAKMMGGGMAMKKIELPADAQARVDRITDSEVFGPVVRVRLALMGIADQEAFIRATNGQTGPVKVGGELAGIKLLRIGVNRVLIEQDGEKKELTLFGGIGGESLLPKVTNAPSTNTPTNSSAIKGPSTNQILSSKKKEIR